MEEVERQVEVLDHVAEEEHRRRVPALGVGGLARLQVGDLPLQ